MADTDLLSNLPSLVVVNDADLALIQQSGNSSRATVGLIRAGLLKVDNNLSDLDDALTARTNLGIDLTQFVTTNSANDFQDNVQSNLQLLQYQEVVEAIGTTGSTQTFDLSNGNVFTATVNANTTFTFAGAKSGSVSQGFTMILTNGGNFAVTFPASVEWNLGTAPTLTENGTDILVFITPDNGTTWYGILSAQDLG